ncbi:MAG: ribosome silencing factor [Clostridia bacterium]|nr:ribosome silencing factor [Clostridia bacterium]
METLELIKIAANALNEKKAKQIMAVKISDLTVLSDYFLICTATSSTQIRALCDEVEDKLEQAGLRPHHIEGRATGWVALDYGQVIIHIFGVKERDYYGLDRMWSDGELLDMNEILDNVMEE